MTQWDAIRWTPSHGFNVGETYTVVNVPRSRWNVWRDRILQWRWDVPLTEPRTYLCTAAGTSDSVNLKTEFDE